MLLVGGLDEDGAPFLSFADLLGTTYSAPTLATGFGAHLAQPLLRRLVPEDEKSVKDITMQQAVEAVKECMKELFYRDAKSSSRSPPVPNHLHCGKKSSSSDGQVIFDNIQT